MDDKLYSFTAKLEKNPDMDAAYVVFPYDLRREFGCGRLAVDALFDGVSYSGSVVNMGVRNGDGDILYVIGVTKEIRSRIGKTFGDELEVVIRPRRSV